MPESVTVFVLLASPFVGSFLTVLIARLPEGRQVVFGRSRCPACAGPIPFRDLVPVAGWVLRRGRCSRCGAEIPVWYPVVELTAAVLAVWAFLVVPGWLALATCILGWSLIVVAFVDWQRLIVPDAVVLPLAAVGLGVSVSFGAERAVDHLIGAAVGYIALRAVGAAYQMLRGEEGLGRGDAKLFAAAGAWVSWVGLPSVLLWACLAGLAVATVRAVRSGRLDPRQKLPFGSFLALGIWLVWLCGPVRIP